MWRSSGTPVCNHVPPRVIKGQELQNIRCGSEGEECNSEAKKQFGGNMLLHILTFRFGKSIFTRGKKRNGRKLNGAHLTNFFPIFICPVTNFICNVCVCKFSAFNNLYGLERANKAETGCQTLNVSSFPLFTICSPSGFWRFVALVKSEPGSFLKKKKKREFSSAEEEGQKTNEIHLGRASAFPLSFFFVTCIFLI